MSKRGFTILELLVVITIVGLLASIVITATKESREKAQFAFAVEQIHQN